MEPLWLADTEVEEEGVHVGESVPLVLPLEEALRDAEMHALRVALPHCERDGV